MNNLTYYDFSLQEEDYYRMALRTFLNKIDHDLESKFMHIVYSLKDRFTWSEINYLMNDNKIIY